MKKLLILFVLLIPIFLFGQTADFTDVSEASKLTAYPDSTDFQYPSSGDTIRANQSLKLRAFVARMMRKLGRGYDNLPTDGKIMIAFGDSTGWFSKLDSIFTPLREAFDDSLSSSARSEEHTSELQSR